MNRRDTTVKAPPVTPTPISATDLADRLGDIFDGAIRGERFQVTRHGKIRMYILGADDYEALTGDAA